MFCFHQTFTTHPVVCIQILGLGEIVDYTQTALIYDQHTLHQLTFTLFPTIYLSVMLILYTHLFYCSIYLMFFLYSFL